MTVCSNKLNVIFNACTRYVCNICLRDHVSLYSIVILGCTLVNYLKYRNCLYMFNLLLTKTPYYIFKGITRSSSARTNNVIIPRSVGRCFSSSLFMYAASLWNKLPHFLKATDSLAIFKKECLNC